MKKFLIGAFLLVQQPSIQLEPLTLEKLAEKFANEHAAESAHCLVLRVTNDQLVEINTKLLAQITDLQKQVKELKGEKPEETKP